MTTNCKYYVIEFKYPGSHLSLSVIIKVAIHYLSKTGPMASLVISYMVEVWHITKENGNKLIRPENNTVSICLASTATSTIQPPQGPASVS